MTESDPILAKRARVARATSLALRAGGLSYALAVVLFMVAVARGFPPVLTTSITMLLVIGSVLLAPAMVIHYAVKAADRADREGSW